MDVLEGSFVLEGSDWMPKFRTSGAVIEADPICAFLANGTAIIGSMPGDTDLNYRGFNVWRSVDGGKTWDPRPTRIDYPRFFDRAFMTVDRRISLPYGRLYVVGYGMTRPWDPLQRDDEMVAFASDDGGKTFQQVATIPTGCGKSAARICVTHPGSSALLSDGTLLTAWFNLYGVLEEKELAPGRVLRNGVRTEEEGDGMSRVAVARLSQDASGFGRVAWVGPAGRWKDEKDRSGTGKWVPAIATDITEGPYRDRVYVAFADQRSGRVELYVSYSTDRGATWSTPSAVSGGQLKNPDEPIYGPHAFTISLAVNNQGTVAVVYYTTNNSRHDPSYANDSLHAEPTIVASTDGGVTWTEPRRLIDPKSQAIWVTPSEERRIAASPYDPRDGYFLPSCAHGFASDDRGVFHALVYEYSAGRPRLFSVAATITN